jgi:hypothetical protein
MVFLGATAYAQSSQKSADDRIVNYTLWLMIFTGVLAVVSAVQIGFLIRADKTARISAEAAKKSVDISEASMIAGARAFVSTAELVPTWEHDKTTGRYSWRFRPTWKNSGNTPTKNLKLYSACELRNTPLPQGFDFDQTITAPGVGLIPPQSENLEVLLLHSPVPQLLLKTFWTFKQAGNFSMCGAGLAIVMYFQTLQNMSLNSVGRSPL